MLLEGSIKQRYHSIPSFSTTTAARSSLYKVRGISLRVGIFSDCSPPERTGIFHEVRR
jgi:hypothetical protein